MPTMPVTATEDFDLRSEGILLQKSEKAFESNGVLNPTCIEKDGIVHMFYRAVAEGNFSTIGYCKLKNNKVIERRDTPILTPEFDYEKHGIEDPRISCVEGVYYLFYTAYDGQSARIAYAESKDLITFEKKGLISPQITYHQAVDLFKQVHMPVKYIWYGQHYMKDISDSVFVWEKDAFLFPKKINGKFAMMNRIMPGMQIIYFDDFSQLQDKDFWIEQLKNTKENTILDPTYWFESRKIGGGVPPIETPDGWLIIYHAVEDEPRVYRSAAALLDLQNPKRVIGRLKEPLFSPTETWETEGTVKNVVFPTAAFMIGDRLQIYYGAADTLIAAKSIDLKSLVSYLKKVGI